MRRALLVCAVGGYRALPLSARCCTISIEPHHWYHDTPDSTLNILHTLRPITAHGRDVVSATQRTPAVAQVHAGAALAWGCHFNFTNFRGVSSKLLWEGWALVLLSVAVAPGFVMSLVVTAGRTHMGCHGGSELY